VIDDLLRPVLKHRAPDDWDGSWSLYWLPMGFRQSAPDTAVVAFLAALIEVVQSTGELKEYTFLEQSAIYPQLTQPFTLHALQYMAIPIIGIRPEQDMPRFPATADIQKMDAKSLGGLAVQKNETMRMEDLFPSAPIPLYWIQESHPLARKELFGQGGWSFILSSHDQEPFFDAWKTILARDTSDEAVKAIPFIAPLLSIKSFTQATRFNLETWFKSFTLYLAENAGEKGLTIASSFSLDEVLIDCVQRSGLRDKGRRR